MLAILGHIATTSGLRIPGDVPFANGLRYEDVRNGIAGWDDLPLVSKVLVITCFRLEDYSLTH